MKNNKTDKITQNQRSRTRPQLQNKFSQIKKRISHLVSRYLTSPNSEEQHVSRIKTHIHIKIHPGVEFNRSEGAEKSKFTNLCKQSTRNTENQNSVDHHRYAIRTKKEPYNPGELREREWDFASKP